MEKVIVITGASSGIGRSTAKKLIAKGHVVYGLSRRIDKMADLARLGAQVFPTDVSDDLSVQEAIARILSEQSRIDVLFNNAGFGVFGTIENIPPEDIRKQFEVNLFGMARMIKAVLPHMRKRKNGMIINTASSLGHISIAGLGWYAATKHAVEAMSDALRMELKHLGIKVVIIEPGAIRTGFDRIAMENLVKTEYPDDYQDLLAGFQRYIKKLYENCENQENTARIVVKAIESNKPRARYVTTRDARIMITLRKFLTDGLYDRISLWLLRN